MSKPSLTRPGLRRLIHAVGLGLVLIALSCASVSACPSCMDARNGRMRWFAYTTGILTFLPVAAIGGGAWWLRRAVREAEAAEAADDSSL